MIKLYNELSFKTSRLITHSYSTSFSIAVSFLKLRKKQAIYSIYGFVRFADEIVDTFENYNKQKLLQKFEKDYYEALEDGISLNPILNAFQITVKQYNIPDELIQAFLKSMYADLKKSTYQNKAEIDDYIYGSADVVGLMCLKVFVNGDDKLYNELMHPASKLGSAFQKINFLRDLKEDLEILHRQYFPGIEKQIFTEIQKIDLIREIEEDLSIAYSGIVKLPADSRLPVLIAFSYFKSLLYKLQKTPSNLIIKKRIRVSDFRKMGLLVKAYFMCKLDLV
jgi:15-cis-phytoene synthase